jgi:hypothetical protein
MHREFPSITFDATIKIEQLDPVHLSIRLLVPPGSALLDISDSQQWLGKLDPAAYTYLWQHPEPHMDDLHKKVASLVEEAERMKADPVETFFQVKALSLAAQGKDFSVSQATQRYGSRKVLPHLTESWFC